MWACSAAKRYTNPPVCSSRPRQKACAHLTYREFYKSILGRKLQNDSRDVRLTTGVVDKNIPRCVTAVPLPTITETRKRLRDWKTVVLVLFDTFRYFSILFNTFQYFSILFNTRFRYCDEKRISSTRVLSSDSLSFDSMDRRESSARFMRKHNEVTTMMSLLLFATKKMESDTLIFYNV